MRRIYIAFLRVIAILIGIILSQWTLTKEIYDIPYCNHVMEHVCEGWQGLKGLPIPYHYADSGGVLRTPVAQSFLIPLVDLIFWIIIFNVIIELFYNKKLYVKKGIKYMLLKNIFFNMLYIFIAILLINIIYVFLSPYFPFYFPL